MVQYWRSRNTGVRIYEDIPIYWLTSAVHRVRRSNVPWQMSGKPIISIIACALVLIAHRSHSVTFPMCGFFPNPYEPCTHWASAQPPKKHQRKENDSCKIDGPHSTNDNIYCVCYTVFQCCAFCGVVARNNAIESTRCLLQSIRWRSY